ncbi:hypothetical protein EIP91_000058 [Steccherinum ochraceum]|uniref:Uncharacterized protein n=1 Tax=Steccherinum ochraceum TaxID=92696 RepID=A0A4R0RUZ5_9APHY|nr:hypothetical protein EIP91_000058 [Steccherinum ochraceum]
MQEQVGFTSMDTSRVLVPLMLVSSQWRRICISDPSLWSRIKVKRPESLSLSLRRSGNIPLRLVWHQPSVGVLGQDVDDSMIEMLAPHLHRTTSLHLVLMSEHALRIVTPLLSLLSKPAKDVTISTFVGLVDGRTLSDNVLHGVQLRSLSLTNFVIPLRSDAYNDLQSLNLTRLELTLTDVLNTLQRSPRLTSLWLFHTIEASDSPSHSHLPTITLNHLGSLSVFVESDGVLRSFLSCVRYPETARLKITNTLDVDIGVEADLWHWVPDVEGSERNKLLGPFKRSVAVDLLLDEEEEEPQVTVRGRDDNGHDCCYLETTFIRGQDAELACPVGRLAIWGFMTELRCTIIRELSIVKSTTLFITLSDWDAILTSLPSLFQLTFSSVDLIDPSGRLLSQKYAVDDLFRALTPSTYIHRQICAKQLSVLRLINCGLYDRGDVVLACARERMEAGCQLDILAFLYWDSTSRSDVPRWPDTSPFVGTTEIQMISARDKAFGNLYAQPSELPEEIEYLPTVT